VRQLAGAFNVMAEKLEQVEEAQVSWQAGTAVVKLSKKVDNEVLKKAVEDQDYQVVSVE
jgi:Cu2+-exporting ATPase